jgi:hypothetical protein
LSPPLLLSVALVAIPLGWPDFAIAPLLLLNWVAFILVQSVHGRRSKVSDLTYSESVSSDRMAKISLLAFSGAGLLTLALGAKIV